MRGQRVLKIISLNTLVDVIRATTVHSRNALLVDFKDFQFNAHLTDYKMTSDNSIGKYRHLVN